MTAHLLAGRSAARRLRRWTPPTAAALTAFAGLLNLASALTPANRARLHAVTEIVPGALTNAAVAATTVSGVLLLLLAHGLRRRKRRAWRAVVGLLAASVVLHVVKGLDIEEALVSAVLMGGLIAYRGEFYAKGDPSTRWKAAQAFALLLLGSVAIGMVLVRMRLGAEGLTASVGAQLRHVLLGLIGVPGPVSFQSLRSTEIVSLTLAGLGGLTAVVAAYLLLRPTEPRAALAPEDEARVRELLARHGAHDSLGYFALRRDKSVVWSPSGKAAVAYRVVSGVALASGNPIGDPEAWPGAISALLRLADEHAWVPAVLGCSEAGGTAYARAGLSVLQLGDEAVLEAERFSLSGRAMRTVRQAVNRIERAGYTAQVRRVGTIPEQEREQVRAVARSWRGAQTERGFSMALGRFGDPADGDCVLVSAVQDGTLRGVLHFVPWGKDGLSLDLMRRDGAADNGVTDFLIVSAVRCAHELGVRRLSLNFSVFREAFERGERLGAGPITRAWRSVLVFASRWFQIQSLYQFNEKFGPQWLPRYVCYRGPGDLPRVTFAALEAEAFLVWPRLRLEFLARLRRRRG